MKRLTIMLAVGALMLVPAYGANIFFEGFEGGAPGSDIDPTSQFAKVASGAIWYSALTIDSGQSAASVEANDSVYDSRDISYTLGTTGGLGKETLQGTATVKYTRKGAYPTAIRLFFMDDNRNPSSQEYGFLQFGGANLYLYHANDGAWDSGIFIASDTATDLMMETDGQTYTSYKYKLHSESTWTVLATVLNSAGYTPPEEVTKVRIGAEKTYYDWGYYDSISIDVIVLPEPATLSILAFGGLVALLRRRKALTTGAYALPAPTGSTVILIQ